MNTPANNAVNEVVIRLHKQLEEASRTLGKVRRYGQPLAKVQLISGCKQRLLNIVSELLTLERNYGVVETSDNRATDGESNSASTEASVGTGGQGCDESGSSESGGQTDPVDSDPQ